MKNLKQTIANRYTKPVITLSKLSLGLIVLCFIAYSQFFAQTDEQEMKAEKRQEKMSSISMVKGKYTVDTAVIWSDRNKKGLLDELALDSLEEKKTVSEIPGFIRAFLDSISPGKKFNMINANEVWCTGDIKDFAFTSVYDQAKQETTCVLSCDSKNGSDKQLVYFGIGKSIALLSYYVGGSSRSQCTALVKFKNDEVIDFWFNNDDLKLWSKVSEIIKSIEPGEGC